MRNRNGGGRLWFVLFVEHFSSYLACGAFRPRDAMKRVQEWYVVGRRLMEGQLV